MLRLSTRNLIRLATRSTNTTVRSTAIRAATIPTTKRLFTSYRPVQQKNEKVLNTSDAELIATLKQEIGLETENVEADQKEESSLVNHFLENSGYKVVANEGNDMIELIKSDGGEVVHVYFSLFDITNNESLIDEEEFDEGAENVETQQAKQQAKQQEGEQAEEFEFDEDQPDFESPIRAKIVIEKPSGALTIETTIHDDLFLIQYVLPTESAELATSNTAEADQQRRNLYQGPVFSTLDPSVQSAIERYLESRGINSEMASFIQEYASSRENHEYISWLQKVKNIVES